MCNRLKIFLTLPILISCTSQDNISNNLSKNKNTDPPETITSKLILLANGEDLVRQGFKTKDDWQINFDHVYVTLNQVKAYQKKLPSEVDSSDGIKTEKTAVLLTTPKTVDLAEGSENAPPIQVSEIEAPIGNYNALSWEVTKSEEKPSQAQTIVLIGKGTKATKNVDFIIQIDKPLNYVCGEFIGDERKGILQPGRNGEVEVTFHFDHIFGDANIAKDDSINTDAVGFQPLADLAQNGSLEVNLKTLEQKLSPENYQKLENGIIGLGHVGEGHCKIEDELETPGKI